MNWPRPILRSAGSTPYCMAQPGSPALARMRCRKPFSVPAVSIPLFVASPILRERLRLSMGAISSMVAGPMRQDLIMPVGQLGVAGTLADGSHAHGFAYLRREQYEIERTWHMLGMKGTGSDTIVANDVLIPAAQFFNVSLSGIGGHEPGKRHVGEPSDYWPFMPFLRATAHAVVAGASAEILERVMDASKRRPIIYTTYAKQSEAVLAQAEVGQAAARISAATAITLKNCELIDQAGLDQRRLSNEERALSKGEGSLAVELLSQGIDQLMFLAGSGAFADANPLQRLYRDFLFAMRHTANLPYVGYEILGKSLLGIEPNIAHPDFI